MNVVSHINGCIEHLQERIAAHKEKIAQNKNLYQQQWSDGFIACAELEIKEYQFILKLLEMEREHATWKRA